MSTSPRKPAAKGGDPQPDDKPAKSDATSNGLNGVVDVSSDEEDFLTEEEERKLREEDIIAEFGPRTSHPSPPKDPLLQRKLKLAREAKERSRGTVLCLEQETAAARAREAEHDRRLAEHDRRHDGHDRQFAEHNERIGNTEMGLSELREEVARLQGENGSPLPRRSPRRLGGKGKGKGGKK